MRSFHVAKRRRKSITSLIVCWLLSFHPIHGIMQRPDNNVGKEVYSLFPHEDLHTGRSFRFPETTPRHTTNYNDRTSDIFRPVNHPRDTLYTRSPAYQGNHHHHYDDNNREYRRNNNNDHRRSRVHFPDENYTPRHLYPYDPYRTRSHPITPNFPTHDHPPPNFSGEEITKAPENNLPRVHVYDPVSKSFILAPHSYRGNPKNRVPTRDGNFIEIGAPGPNLFKDHDAFLEYHRKLAEERATDSKKLLFSGKQPYEIENQLRKNHEDVSRTTTEKPKIRTSTEINRSVDDRRNSVGSTTTQTPDTEKSASPPRVVVVEYEKKRRNGNVERVLPTFPSSTVKSDRARVPLSFKFSRFDSNDRIPGTLDFSRSVVMSQSDGREERKNKNDGRFPVIETKKNPESTVVVDNNNNYEEIVEQVESSQGPVLHTNGFVPVNPFQLFGTTGETPRARPSFVVTKVENAEMRTEMTNDDKNNNIGMATYNSHNNGGQTTPSYKLVSSTTTTTTESSVHNKKSYSNYQQNYLPSPPRFFTITKPKDPTIITNQLLQAISKQKELQQLNQNDFVNPTEFQTPKRTQNENPASPLPTPNFESPGSISSENKNLSPFLDTNDPTTDPENSKATLFENSNGRSFPSNPVNPPNSIPNSDISNFKTPTLIQSNQNPLNPNLPQSRKPNPLQQPNLNEFHIPPTSKSSQASQNPATLSAHVNSLLTATEKATSAFPSINPITNEDSSFPFNEPKNDDDDDKIIDPHFSDMDHIILDKQENDKELPTSGFKPIDDPFFDTHKTPITNTNENGIRTVDMKGKSTVKPTHSSDITKINQAKDSSNNQHNELLKPTKELIQVTRLRTNDGGLKNDDGSRFLNQSPPEIIRPPIQKIMLSQDDEPDYQEIERRHQYGTVIKEDELPGHGRMKMMTFVSVKEKDTNIPITEGRRFSNANGGSSSSNGNKSSRRRSKKTKNRVGAVKKKNVLISSISSSGHYEDHGSSNDAQVVKKVHAHISHCPKLNAPAEVICDVHVNEGHRHPNPQLTVGWKRTFPNTSHSQLFLPLANTSLEIEEDDNNYTSQEQSQDELAHNATLLTDYHDKFHVKLAPGISPILRSVLFIRSVRAPDTGNYQCSVSDGRLTLTSETLLFLCH